MPGTQNNLNRTLLTETQAQKATGANTQIGEVDAALTHTTVISLLSTDTAYVITAAILQRASLLVFSPAGATPIASDFTVSWTPLKRGFMTFYNNTAYNMTVFAASGPTPNVKLPPGGSITLYLSDSYTLQVGTSSAAPIKQPVRAASTANVASLSGTTTIDGVSLVAGDRVLLKDQTTGSQNGIWVIAAGAWTRAADFTNAGDVISGVIIAVQEGTANGNTAWMLTTDGAITPGTTAIAFAQFGGGGGGGGSSPGNPAPVRAATTANITLSGAQTIDGVSCVAGDRVLVKDQTTGSQNGIYVVAAGAWSRATDFDTDTTEVISGARVMVTEGTVHQGRFFALSTTGAIVTGTTSLTFKRLATYNPIYPLGPFFSGTPDVSITMFEHLFPVATTLPANMAGALGRVGTNPASTTNIDVQKNGSTCGTIAISAAGAFTFTTSGGTAVSFAVGDRIGFVTPSNLNGLSNLSVTLLLTQVT